MWDGECWKREEIERDGMRTTSLFQILDHSRYSRQTMWMKHLCLRHKTIVKMVGIWSYCYAKLIKTRYWNQGTVRFSLGDEIVVIFMWLNLIYKRFNKTKNWSVLVIIYIFNAIFDRPKIIKFQVFKIPLGLSWLFNCWISYVVIECC